MKQPYLPIYQCRCIFSSIIVVKIKNILKLKWPKIRNQQLRVRNAQTDGEFEWETTNESSNLK